LVFGVFILAAFFNYQVISVKAGDADFFGGWLWNDHIGWVSANCVDQGTCGVQDYGVDMNSSTGDITGWGWSDNVGWVCFGSTCPGITPEGGGGYAGWDSITKEIGGWAKVIFDPPMENDGWISLNCANPGVCGTSNYKIILDDFDDDVSGFGWSANDNSGDIVGLGWFDFDQMYGRKELICDDSWDNDGDGLIDCEDPDCPCGWEELEPLCTDTINNDADAWIDCLDHEPDFAHSCWHHDPYCPSNEALAWYWDGAAWYQPGGDITCHDGSDNDYDDGFGNWDSSFASGRDCLDIDCQPFCEEICGDGFDNDGDGLADCDDPDCGDVCIGVCDPDNCSGDPCDDIGEVCPGTYGDPPQACMCVAKPWLETKWGNVYSQLGVQGPPAPTGLANATYCVVAATGGVEQFDYFTSELGCYLLPEDVYGFPSQLNKYTNILGNLDIQGIISGRYGTVVEIDDAGDIPANLDGKIYYSSNNDLDFEGELPVINNGFAGQSGAGLIIVQGDITFDSNVVYQLGNISKLKELASVGWVAFKDPISGHGGHIYVGRDATELVGAFYAEEQIVTRDAEKTLDVSGLMISKDFDFNRLYSSEARGAEQVIFDGRALANPPPGMEDLTRSLPSIRDIVPSR